MEEIIQENGQKLRIGMASDTPVQGVYSNAVSVHVNPNEVVLDFGYSTPNSNPPEIHIVSRVNMNHKNAESFLTVLQNAMLDFRNKMAQQPVQQPQNPQQPPMGA
mgnify:CR=1 FL=1